MKKSGKDLVNTLMENVIKIVQKELKQILKKDINKKLCESYAYLLFDQWWSQQVRGVRFDAACNCTRGAVCRSARFFPKCALKICTSSATLVR